MKMKNTPAISIIIAYADEMPRDPGKKMEAWVGIEPTRHGFANRSLSHSSTTPWFAVIYSSFPEKQVPNHKNSLFFH